LIWSFTYFTSYTALVIKRTALKLVSLGTEMLDLNTLTLTFSEFKILKWSFFISEHLLVLIFPWHHDGSAFQMLQITTHFCRQKSCCCLHSLVSQNFWVWFIFCFDRNSFSFRFSLFSNVSLFQLIQQDLCYGFNVLGDFLNLNNSYCHFISIV